LLEGVITNLSISSLPEFPSMKKLRYALLILTLLSPVGLFAQADASDHGPAGGPRRGMMSVDDELNMLSERLALTDAQKPQVKTILQDQRDQMKKLMEDSSTGRDEKFSQDARNSPGVVG